VPGIKPKGKVKIKWSRNFAYGIGLIVSDGCLSKNGRHISFTSKDKDLALFFKEVFGLDSKLGKKSRADKGEKKYYVVQFGDVIFYKFLVSIGIMSNKSKIIKGIKVPKKYFFEFLRGLFDGEGHSYSYWDKRWKSSFMLYTGFSSASKEFIKWLRARIGERLGIYGSIDGSSPKGYWILRYAKNDSLKIIKKMYPKNTKIFLPRKRLKLIKALSIMGEKI